MRNTIISAICVAAVILYSIFTSIYINDFSNQINTELSLSVNISDVNVDNINNIYNEKKKILDIIINRDHLEEIEDIIINLESAVKFNDTQAIYTTALNLKSTIEHIKKLNGFKI